MILYLHGFRSSPQSFKARLLAARLAELGRGDEWSCPMLPASPFEAMALAEREVARRLCGRDMDAGNANIAVIGSSLGGYFATHLAEKHGWRAVLLNPVVAPQRDLNLSPAGEQRLWQGNGSPAVEPRHLDELRALGIEAITRPERYYLIVASGDEVLDYHKALAHYAGVRTRVLDGADHALSGFPDYVDDVLAFCDA